MWDNGLDFGYLDPDSHFLFFYKAVRCACLYVCVSVCPLAYLKKLHVQTSRTFLYMLTTAVALSSSDDSATRYVSPVLWMTSCFHIMGQIQIQAWSLRCNDIILAERCNSSAYPTGCVCVSVSKARYTLPVLTGRDASVHGKCPRPVDTSVSLNTRVHGPCTRPVNAGSVYRA